ncbi:MAG: hypothetical protein KF862_01185 [Chitinophagaceae bacterium]|nr:hypothetical protein [Chitinophagaceae bacterium]
MYIETGYYIARHFPRLLTKTEGSALRHYNAMFKIGNPDKYDSIDTYNERLKWHNDDITDDPDTLRLIEAGITDFYINAATRILNETPEKVFLNACPNCNRLARTPYARQCKHCGHSWHDTIAANFKVNKVFSLTQRPSTLFFAGDIKSGTVKKGMRIDLTFLGLAIKPIITTIEFIDHISEKRAEVALGVTVEQADDFEYLKNHGVLAIPIIIEQ